MNVSNRSLVCIVVVLGIGVWLALTNPTMHDYVAFLEQQVVPALAQRQAGQAGLLGSLLAGPGRQIIGAVIEPNTQRRNYGLFSLFETGLFGERVLVLGVGGRFVPLQGIESVAKKIEALGLPPAK